MRTAPLATFSNFVVLVWVDASGDDPTVLGPFDTPEEAQHWVDRLSHHYHRCKVDRMLSGRINVAQRRTS